MTGHDIIHKLTAINNQLIRAKILAEKLQCSNECPHCVEMREFLSIATNGISEIVLLGDAIHINPRTLRKD